MFFKSLAVSALSLMSASAWAQSGTDSPKALDQAYFTARKLAASGEHFEAAAMFFNVYTVGSARRDASLALLTENLVEAGYPNAASYFFIKTLQSGTKTAVRHVLPLLPHLMDAVGGDLLRKYVLRHTTPDMYDAATSTHFYYFLAKDNLLKGDPNGALRAASQVSSGSDVIAQVAYLKGAAYAMLGQTDNAIAAFETCAAKASRTHMAADDLKARCTAGKARTYYQAGAYDKADDTFDDIPKVSFVWTDILFEQAWNAYAKGDYNRALGRLVTYRSPDLGFVFNPEIDVLRAQSYLSLCLYDDVNKVVQDFFAANSNVGLRLKEFLVSHDQDLGAFYSLAKQVYAQKLHTSDSFQKAINRFARGPYFAALVREERMNAEEASRIQNHAQSHEDTARFAQFLGQVTAWRAKSIRLLGGAFVKNSMLDIYQDLLANLDKMSFIKLEMLKHSKQVLEHKNAMSTDEDGVVKRGSSDVNRRDYQYYWSFNGEFWLDELGDYVFALESQCGG